LSEFSLTCQRRTYSIDIGIFLFRITNKWTVINSVFHAILVTVHVRVTWVAKEVAIRIPLKKTKYEAAGQKNTRVSLSTIVQQMVVNLQLSE
jgi:hypothetical protein